MKRLVSGLLACVMLMLCACTGEVEGGPSESPSAEPNIPSKFVETPPPTKNTADMRGIAGSHATDIRMGLTKFGLKEAPFSAAPDEAKKVYAHSCSTNYTDEILGVAYDYSLTLDSDFQIIGATFGISNKAAKADAYKALAAIYLGFCATMPYDESDIEAAKIFVEDNLSDISAKNSAEIVIGDAKFELRGLKAGDYFGEYLLEISKVS